jgi:hypothetical protein
MDEEVDWGVPFLLTLMVSHQKGKPLCEYLLLGDIIDGLKGGYSSKASNERTNRNKDSESNKNGR